MDWAAGKVNKFVQEEQDVTGIHQYGLNKIVEWRISYNGYYTKGRI